MAKKAAAKRKSGARKTAGAKKRAGARKTGTNRKTGTRKKAGTRRKAAKRERIDTGTDKRFVRRGAAGKFKESDDIGKSLTSDRRKKARTRVKSGQGDRGDR
jgi:hypothetical protein